MLAQAAMKFGSFPIPRILDPLAPRILMILPALLEDGP